jgi:hypothetical protein
MLLGMTTQSPLLEHDRSSRRTTRTRWDGLFWLLFGLAAAGYLFQSFTPLRLTRDAIIYLSLGSSAAHGHGFLFENAPSKFPSGYPWIIKLLTMAGLGRSLYLNLFNFLALGLGVLALRSIARTREVGPLIFRITILICMFSYPMIKHAALPLSDLCFFGVSLSAVAIAERASHSHNTEQAVVRWVMALLLALATVGLRIAGAGVILALFVDCSVRLLRVSRRLRLVAMLLLGAVGAGSLFIFTRWAMRPGTTAGTDVSLILRMYLDRSIFAIIGDHFVDLGQIVINVPSSFVPGGLVIYYLAGFLALIVAVFFTSRAASEWSPSRTFVVFYTAMIFFFAYPVGTGSEPRLLLPVLPLFIFEVLSAAPALNLSGKFRRRVATLAGVYLGLFLVAGAGAFVYSARITASRDAFLRSQGIALWRTEYESWLRHSPIPPGAEIDPDVPPVLREYGGDR